MTGKLLNFGSEEGKAAGIKLTGNLFLLTLTAGIFYTLALANSLDSLPAGTRLIVLNPMKKTATAPSCPLLQIKR